MPKRKGSENFSSDDCEEFLERALQVVPICAANWDQVAGRYNSEYAGSNRRHRTGKSLRLKYKALVAQKKPTGSGTRPRRFILALRLRDAIREKVGWCSRLFRPFGVHEVVQQRCVACVLPCSVRLLP